MRSTDKRRLRREPGGRLREEEVEAEQGGQRWTHQSAKASFLAKARSGLLGYGSDPQLLHFVWDLVANRLAVAVHHHQPLRVVLSLRLWLEDELQKCLAARLQAPVGETLHIAHVLTETIRGLLAGDNEGAKGGQGHVFDVPADAEDRNCTGYWRAKRGGAGFVQLTGRKASQRVQLQLILSEPLEILENKWTKERREYYMHALPAMNAWTPWGKQKDRAPVAATSLN